jgi:DNA-binding response OmpR family regulator
MGVDLDRYSRAILVGQEFEVSPQRAWVLLALAQQFPKFVPTWTLSDDLPVSRVAMGDASYNHVRVVVRGLRKALGDDNIVSERGRGYRLAFENVATQIRKAAQLA